MDSAKFFDRITADWPSLKVIVNKFEKEWEGEELPLTMLCAEIGEVVVKIFSTSTEPERKKLLDIVEDGVASSDEKLSTAVATGLVEEIIRQCDKDPDLWKKIAPYFGVETEKYGLAWKNWTP